MAIIGNAYIAVHAITTGFQNDVNKSLSGLNSQFSRSGNQSGTAFSNGLRRGSNSLSAFRQQAKRANDAFFAMVTTGYALGPAIAVAVGAVSSLVSGFVALGAQVGAAIPSLIVLPSILAAIGQAAIVAKLAFGGIGEALKQMTKTGGGGGGGEAAEEARRKRIENAEKNLARVLENNRETLARASRNLTDAEKRLTDARKEAAESLQQLNFDAEDAAISEKKAAIELEKARETLARVQDLPPNSRARREAELAYAEADLNLRRAKDRNADLAKATEEANAKGVEGSEEVVNASRDAEDAREDLARAERDALRAQIDAEEELAEAKKKTAQAGGGASATDAYDKLTGAAKAFVDYLISIKPKLQELKDAAAEALLPPLQLAIKNLVDNLFPRLIPIIQETGKALGNAAIDFSNFVTEGRNLDKLDRVAATNVDTIGKLGTIVGSLYDSFLSLLAAADPLVRRFTDWVVVVTTGWQETLNAKLATGELTDTFNKAGDVAAQLGSIFGNIWGALMNIGEAAAGPGSGGQKLLDLFEDSTARFEEFTQKLLDTGRLEKFFLDVADNVNSVSQLVVDLVKEFLKLGDDKAIGDTAQALRPFVQNIGAIFATLQSAAPYLGEFLGKLTDLILKFTETGSIQAFFETLGKGLDVLNAFFGNETVMKIFMIIAPIMGMLKALTLMSKVGGFAFKVLFGYFVKFGGLITAAKTGLTGLGALLGGAAGTGALVAGGIIAVAAAFYMMWQNSEKFRDAIKDLVDVVWGTLKDAFESIKATLDNVLKSFGGTSGAMDGLSKTFKAVGDFVAKYFIPIIKTQLVFAINLVTGAIKIFINIVGAIIKAFQAVWEFVKGVFALLRGDMDGVKEHFGNAFNAILDAFRFVFGAIGDFFKLIWDAIVAAVETGWGIIKPIWDLIKTVFEGAWEGIQKVFNTVWDAIKTSISTVWNNVIKPIFDAFSTVWDTVWGAIQKVFNTVWGGIETAIGKVSGFFKTVFGEVRDFVAGVLSGIVNGVKELPGKLLAFVGDLLGAATGLGKAILDGVIGGLKTLAAAAGNVADVIKDAIVKALKIAFNTLIALPINTAVRKGVNLLDSALGPAINFDDPPDLVPTFKLAKGGIVPAVPGGSLALIGEAGRSERVEPLDPDGLSRRDKAMIQMLAGPTSGKSVVVNVYPSKGMDEAELASMVSRQLAFQLRKGAA